MTRVLPLTEMKLVMVRQAIDELCGATLSIEGALYHIATLVGAERGYDGSRDGELSEIAAREPGGAA